MHCALVLFNNAVFVGIFRVQVSHLDTTLTLMIEGHRVGHCSTEGQLLTPLTPKQIKAVEKTLRGKVPKNRIGFEVK